MDELVDEILTTLNIWRGLPVDHIKVDSETFLRMRQDARDGSSYSIDCNEKYELRIFGKRIVVDDTVPGFEIVGIDHG